ncbi:helix-turn-helix transcriptional regulator [Streptomyces sp. AV19]|uniref:helix-turn-helix domain-containing protein n=1 Tax=Streptomyces sp. AV19 TaxID=2793068 RepID=UPI0018FECEF3|nr:helix-turn-helix transcriptional regulator [Streptomyces sp. AV19]MBH1934484.1 helix-turn-helix transcriptional regulator [Streptomyces sp. AV19]MDG4533276.1 helix-turn-helix transcriptional regulator [Streptomyces sp. AV19]
MLDDVITSRQMLSHAHPELDELSAGARQFVQAAALIGEEFTLQEVAQLQSVTTLSLLPSLDEVLAAGVVEFAGDRLAFASAEAHRALQEQVPSRVRHVLLHSVSPSHRHEAADPAVPAVPAVPEEEPVISPDNSPGAAEELLSGLFRAESAAGERLSSSAEKELHTALTRQLSGLTDVAAAGNEADLVVGLFKDDARGRKDRAREILRAHRAAPVSAIAAIVLSNLEWAAGSLDEGLHWGREALRLANGALPVTWRPYPSLALGAKLNQLGRFCESATEIGRARALAERLRHHRAIADSMIANGRVLMGRGHMAQAEAELGSSVSLAHRLGDSTTASHGLALMSLISLARGENGRAADQVWRAGTELAGRPRAALVAHQWADVRVSAEHADPRNAVKLLVGRYPELVTEPSLFLRDHAAAAWLVRLARRAADTSLAASAVRAVERLAQPSAADPAYTAAALHAWALLHDNVEALECAVRQHRYPFAAAAADEDLGMLLMRRGGRDASVGKHLRAARDRYRSIGASAAAGRVESVLRELGTGFFPPRSSHQAPPAAVSLDDLTEAELRIAHLVAGGMTNRQVATRLGRSPHTVNYHLRQIFRKLNIGSRVELARLLD